MDLFTLALVSHMDTIPANMDLFALLGINNVDTMRERNIDKWLITGESSEQVQRLVVVDLPGALPLETLAWSPVE